MLGDNSKFQIEASISHTTNLYITNIDNTSDRRVDSSIDLKIHDSELDCYIRV